MIEPHFLQFLDSKPWGSALRAVQEGEPLAECDLDFLFDECLKKPIQTVYDHLDFCRQFYLLARLDKKRHFAPLFDKFASTSYPKSFQLPRFYLALIKEGLQQNSGDIDLPSIFVEKQGRMLEWNMTGPQMVAELGAVALHLGILKKDSQLIRSALRLAHFAIETHEKMGLWQKEREFSEFYHSFWHAQLFTLASFVSNFSKFRLLADVCTERLREAPSDVIVSITPYYWILSQYLLDTSSDIEVLDDREDGSAADHLFCYQFDKLSATFTFLGCGTGVGAVQKGAVSIRTMGPSLDPTHDPQSFGIDRPAALWDSTGVQMKKEPGRFMLHGWAPMRVQSWMELRVEAVRSRLQVSIRFDEEIDGHFLLFAKSKRAVVNENFSLKPATLDRYVGAPVEVALYSDHDQIKIFPDDSVAKLQVIPLAGGSHFWGSHFLIALTPSTAAQGLTFTLV